MKSKFSSATGSCSDNTPKWVDIQTCIITCWGVAMKSRIIGYSLATWFFLGCAYAEGWQTNNVSVAKAVQIASGLWRGMSEQQVVKAVEKEDGLRLTLAAGVARGTYDLRIYSLRDGCSLQLKMQGRASSYLGAASIESNGVKVVSITLTNAPQQDGPANGSQPIRAETNRTSSAAGSRR